MQSSLAGGSAGRAKSRSDRAGKAPVEQELSCGPLYMTQMSSKGSQ